MREVPRLLVLALGALVAACAQGVTPGTDDDDDVTPIVDARSDDTDASVPGDGPLATDARAIDAGCTPSPSQRLLNPAFDGTPLGMGWIETLADPTEPLVRADGLAEHTAPNAAWLGGIEGGRDSMYQELVIPAGATGLVLRGQYQVRSSEFVGGIYDHGFVELVTPSGTLLESVLALTNDSETTAWTAFMRQFTGDYGGQTVRIQFRSTNDATDATSFYFDTLTLDATVCQ